MTASRVPVAASIPDAGISTRTDSGSTLTTAPAPSPAPAFSGPRSPAAIAALARRVAEICLEHRGQDVVLINLAGVSDMADWFVVATGTSDTHVRSMADHVIETLRGEEERVYHVEGLPQGRWVLLDFVDVVVHLFHPTLRAFYQLERLWGDAEITSLSSEERAR